MPESTILVSQIRHVKYMRRAFSLMELMLVVVIIGLIYAMALSNFKIPDAKSVDQLNFSTLPQYLRENFPLEDVKLVCFEPCGECGFLVNGKWNEDKLDLFKRPDVSTFRIDKEGFTHPAEYPPYDIKDAYKQACFVLHKQKNDAIEEVVLEVGKEIYYYKAAYEGVLEYDSLPALEQAYQHEIAIIEDEQ